MTKASLIFKDHGHTATAESIMNQFATGEIGFSASGDGSSVVMADIPVGREGDLKSMVAGANAQIDEHQETFTLAF